MANRSYLYSTNIIPGPNAKAGGRKLIGISQWDYDIPIVFKLLLSGSPRTCPSSIWKHPEEIALTGDYVSGVKNLENFLSKVTLPSAQPLIAEAIVFLSRPENQNQYFILECGEIFEMEETPVFEQNRALLEQLAHLQPEVEKALKSVVPHPAVPPKKVGFLSKLLGHAPVPSRPVEELMNPVYALGLGNWSNKLYFEFTNEHSDT